MAISATQFTLLCVIGIILLARPAHAFGAGNIGSTSKIEGENWRHGDLEDTFLTLVASRAMGGKKFSKLDVKRIYFGNWLRDYSQAVDVGTVKNISAEAIRVVLWILGFMSFGYGTKEFEVTTERLGCYRPEEHIDNPKDYADNEDARRYDRRLRAPIDEERELAIDPELGLKAYIASENLGIDTSAGLVRKLFGRSIELGRRYARNNNKADLHEALRLLGTGCHCLEDFSAHSNYTELVLIELGERDIFPHVGRNCRVRLRGARSPVYPLVTGTFGGVDFLHSVTGEFDDKVTQSEIQELEGTLQQAQQQGENTSVIQDLLQKLPEGVFGGKDEAGKADELKTNAAQTAMANAQISPRQPEAWLQYITDVQKQIYPILEWHDEIMQSITEFVDKIPILPEIIENVSEQVNIFVFSLLAPLMLPIISQIKTELNTGSSTIIQSSVDKQHIVFSDDNCSDPTHSMLSKDHFSNVLNEPAGKVAGQVLRWVVPQLIAAWDDERIDVDRTLNRIIRGVFHHPALRQVGEDGSADGRGLMFGIVEQWWASKSEMEKDGLRGQLNRDGVEQGRNHKPGVQDHGHGSAKKLGMPNIYTANHQGAPGGFGGPSGGVHDQAIAQLGQTAGEAVGGGILGTLVGGLTSAVGRGVVAGAMGDQPENTETFNRTTYGNDGSRTQTVTQLGGDRTSGNYGQAQYSRTDDRFGGRVEQFTRTEQQYEGGGAYSGQVTREQRSTYGGNYSETRRFETNTASTYGRHEEPSGGYGSAGLAGSRNTYGQPEAIGGFRSEQTPPINRRREQEPEHPSYGRRKDDDDEKPTYGRRNQGETEQPSYGRRKDDDDDDERPKHGRRKSKGDSDDEKPKYGRQRKDSDDDKPKYTRRKDDDDDDKPKYGRRKADDDDDKPKYRRRKDSDDEKPKYGRQRKDSDDEKPKHGRRKSKGDSDDDKPKYGRRGNDDESETPSYGRRQQQPEYAAGGYGQQSGFSRTERSDEYGSAGGYGQQTSTYGRTGGTEYGGRQEQSYGAGAGGYGRANPQDEYSSGRGVGGGYGGTRRRNEDASEEMPGGFGGAEEETEQPRSYGRRRNENDESEGGYGGRRRGGDEYGY